MRIMKKYPVVTLCGSTRFKEDFLRVQKGLTLQGNIVISVGLFGHSGDTEVWEGMDEDTLTETKLMLDDMHKAKIDMADSIYVINPGGYIGASTWSEICYARMTRKAIRSIEAISENAINLKVNLHISMAEALAYRQWDFYSHTYQGETMGQLRNEYVLLEKGKNWTLDPFVPADDDPVPRDTDYFAGHAAKGSGYDPTKRYGRKEFARFVETILARGGVTLDSKPKDRDDLKKEVEHYMDLFRGYGIEYPEGYPDTTEEELERWIMTWSEFNP